MDNMPPVSVEVDAIGLRCPMPVLRLAKALRGVAPGAVVRLLADDGMAAIDVPHFCAEGGHKLLSSGDAGAGRFYLVRRCAA